jgi:hypothetical protein
MMEVARLCSEASERLTVSAKKQLIGRLPFKEATFSKFVQIGKDARLQRLHARRLLPPHYTIAYPLTRLTDEQLETAAKQGVINPDMKRAELQSWLKARQLWMANASPADHSAQIADGPDAEVITAQDEQTFAALETAWNAALALRTAWTNATDPARERFVRKVLRVSPLQRRPHRRGSSGCAARTGRRDADPSACHRRRREHGQSDRDDASQRKNST